MATQRLGWDDCLTFHLPPFPESRLLDWEGHTLLASSSISLHHRQGPPWVLRSTSLSLHSRQSCHASCGSECGNTSPKGRGSHLPGASSLPASEHNSSSGVLRPPSFQPHTRQGFPTNTRARSHLHHWLVSLAKLLKLSAFDVL